MKKIQLVIQTAFLGDLILTIPFLNQVKKKYPKDSIVLICKKGLGQFLKNDQVVDEYIEIDKGDRNSYKKAISILNSQNFVIDNLFCIHRSIRSILFASQINAKYKIGFSSFFAFWVFDECVSYEEKWPDAIRKFKLLESLDSEVRENVLNYDYSYLNSLDDNLSLISPPQVFAFKEINLSSKEYLSTPTKVITLFPGSVWETKKWTMDGFIEVALYFINKGYEVQLLGGQDEFELCQKISEQVASQYELTSIQSTNKKSIKIKNFAGQLNLNESLKRVQNSNLVIANDSAATHMAAYRQTACVTLFGPTTLSLGFRPWSSKAKIVENNELNCRPCGKHGHHNCPLGHHHCMKKISANEVIQAAEVLLK